MDMHNVSIVGWLHTIACTLAILIGGFVLLGGKGTPRHRSAGRWYVYVMIVANLSSFAVYHFDIGRFVPFAAGPGVFGLFHWEAVFTLGCLLLGWLAATRQRYAFWAYLHPIMMLVTYYMLMGGLVNEILVRVPFVRSLAQASGPHIRNPTQTPLGGMMQGVMLLAFVVLVVVFCIDVARSRRARLVEATAL